MVEMWFWFKLRDDLWVTEGNVRIGQILELDDYGIDGYLWSNNFQPPKGFGLGQLMAEKWSFLFLGPNQAKFPQKIIFHTFGSWLCIFCSIFLIFGYNVA